MSEEDMSNLLNQFSTMVNNNDDLRNMLNNFSSSSSGPSHTEENSGTAPNLDIETIMKIKSIMDAVNSKDDARSNLLLSLKPFLNDSKKSKLDQYVKFLSLSKVFEAFNSTGGDQNK